jgi:arylsulfatase A-like enzyme
VSLIEASARGEEAGGSDRQPHFAELDRSWGVKNREPQPLIAITRGPYRLIDNLSHPDRAELYDVDEDPQEQRNLADERPEVLSELRAEIEQFLAAEKLVDSPQVELDEMRQAQLRALGYVVRE